MISTPALVGPFDAALPDVFLGVVVVSLDLPDQGLDKLSLTQDSVVVNLPFTNLFFISPATEKTERKTA